MNLLSVSSLIALVTLSGLTLRAQESATTTNRLAVAQSLAPAMVHIQYQLQSDKGDNPRANLPLQRCPRCGQFHVNNLSANFEQERPYEMAGFLVAPTMVVSADPLLHSRFVKAILVCFGDQSVPAHPLASAADQGAVFLELEKPFEKAKPLTFPASASRPALVATLNEVNAEWNLLVEPFPSAIAISAKGKPFISLPNPALITDGAGAALGLCLTGELPLDDSWKGQPADWRQLKTAEVSRLLGNLEKITSQGLLQVRMGFRSPKANVMMGMRSRDDDDREGTDHNAVGILLDGNKLLVLANLKPKVTARLESLALVTAEGQSIPLKFNASLKDYGAFIATVEKPLPGAIKITATPLADFRHRLLLAAEVLIQGDNNVRYFQPARIPGFELGEKGLLYPIYTDEKGITFLFDTTGQLLAIPVGKREKPTTEQRYGTRETADITPMAYLMTALANLPANSDLANVPLSEAEENRLAWLGVELQPLDKELARVNNVAAQTQDGDTGALITYVYPNSPAAKAGLEQGAILLRLRTPSEPNPIEIKLDKDRGLDRNFPWDRYDEIPEQYFERIPTPWPSPENTFTRLLTDLGFGTEFTLEYISNGKLNTRKFTVEASPEHFDSTARFKAEALGLTVRNLTYEVRLFLQKKADEPGVIISKIETGSKASIAGLKPYELITHINDQPVNNVKDFEKLAAAGGELRLSIKRMAKGRIVTVRANAKE